jgi:acetolactate synthase-1/2/3 large subunit
LRELRAALPRDAIVFVDNGTMRTWAGRFFPVYQEGSFFVNMGMASMGYAVAGAIGGQLAAPGRTVVALAGDAAFAMNGMEVHTAAEYDAPVIWVVVNNGGHGMVYHGEKRLFNGKFHSGVFRKRVDVAGLARAMGAASCTVDRPGDLARAVREAVRRRAPCVIDVTADLHEAPPSSARDEALKRQLVAA